MARANKKPQLIEFKGMTLPIVSVTLHSLHVDPLAVTATELFGDDAFFDGDAAVLELDRIDPTTLPGPIDWPALQSLFAGHGLRVIGVRGGDDALRESAAGAGLPCLAAFKRPAREPENAQAAIPPQPAEREPTPPPAPAAPASPPPPIYKPTMVITRPLRSGQQAYARGSDLVVLAAVNAGAEVIADGSIHIYAPLRGRALAGASGSTEARIFTTRFEAELVSIAGVYRTFEGGIPDQLTGKPVQVQLVETENGTSTTSQLSIRALDTD
jgi:septum site-determining protein MinC